MLYSALLYWRCWMMVEGIYAVFRVSTSQPDDMGTIPNFVHSKLI